MVNRVRWKKNEQLGWLLLSDNVSNRFLDAKKIRKFEDLLEIFSNNMEKLIKKEVLIIIEKFTELLYSLYYVEKSLIFNTFIEKLLLEEGNKGKTVKIYGIID